MNRMNSSSSDLVIFIVRPPRHVSVPNAGLEPLCSVRAETRRRIRNDELGKSRLEEELPEPVIAVLTKTAADVHREELVLRVAELLVPSHQAGALKPQPLVRPDAFFLRADHDVVDSKAPHD